MLLLGNLVAVEVAVALLPERPLRQNRVTREFLIFFRVLGPANGGMELADSHTPNFDVIGGSDIPPADVVAVLVHGIVDFAAELGVLVQIGEVGAGEVDFDCVVALLLLLLLLLVLLGSLSICNRLVDVPLLLLGLLQLLQHLRADTSHVEFR